jgi:hypothetical protein
MSGHPQQGHYDDGYGHHQQGNTDSYYQDDQNQEYYDHNGHNAGYADQAHPHGEAAHHQGGDGYYDESYEPKYPQSRENIINSFIGVITTLMQTIHTNMTEVTTRARSMEVNTKTSITTINTTTNTVRLLRDSNRKARELPDVEVIRKRIRRPSAISQ